MAAVHYREASLDDATLASDVMTASYPALAQDPVMTRMRWKLPRRGFRHGRFIAERDGRPIAFLAWVHGPWEEVGDLHCDVEVWLERAAVDSRLLATMFGWIGDLAVADGARLLIAYCGEDEPAMLEALAALGYRRERVERVWELDLVERGASITERARRAREQMARASLRWTTFADWDDPDGVKKLYELNQATVKDVPHSVAIVPEAFADFEIRVSAPDRPHDRFWIALAKDRPVAMSYLKYPPVRGTVWTGYTCTHPEFRGRGLATAIKLQSLAQAVELGVPAVRTSNDFENAPMLHINEGLGYVSRPGFVEHHKRVTSFHA